MYPDSGAAVVHRQVQERWGGNRKNAAAWRRGFFKISKPHARNVQACVWGLWTASSTVDDVDVGMCTAENELEIRGVVPSEEWIWLYWCSHRSPLINWRSSEGDMSASSTISSASKQCSAFNVSPVQSQMRRSGLTTTRRIFFTVIYTLFIQIRIYVFFYKHLTEHSRSLYRKPDAIGQRLKTKHRKVNDKTKTKLNDC